ncbi:MAG: HIT family protein [Acidimicrobiales bacterium]
MGDDDGSGSQPGCIFCAIVAGDAPSRRIYEDDHTLAFLDINPLTLGHSLVIPKRHSVDLHDIPEADLAAVARSAKIVAAQLTDRLGSDGVNLLNACGAAAWQTVFHFHMHVLPRVAGDIPFPFPQRGAAEDELEAVFNRITGR